MRLVFERTLLCSILLLTLAACRREPAGQVVAPGTEPPAATPAGPLLQDVAENTPGYVIGISFPPGVSRYPGLAAELERYADTARDGLMQAVQARGNDVHAPYELVLPFRELHVSPALVVVGVDGSSYTGGAHGVPLIARWVWLPQQHHLLRASDLVPDPEAWKAISALVREQLHSALSQRIDVDALSPEQRVDVLGNANEMIEDGTVPDPEHFSQFEPVVAADGRITALRFVFAPYQVGPYADGTQTVEIPAASLLPHIAPAYRTLFRTADSSVRNTTRR